MTCSRRTRGETHYRCWSVECAGCQKTYRAVAANIVDGILEEHPDLRTVWWLAVPRIARDCLTDYWNRLYQRLDYHDRLPDHWLWFVVETRDEAARYLIADRDADADWLDHYWTRYGGLPVDVFERDRDELVQDVASHCGEVTPPYPGRRMGSSNSLPGVSPRRRSSGRTTPTAPEIAYSGWVEDVPAD